MRALTAFGGQEKIDKDMLILAKKYRLPLVDMRRLTSDSETDVSTSIIDKSLCVSLFRNIFVISPQSMQMRFPQSIHMQMLLPQSIHMHSKINKLAREALHACNVFWCQFWCQYMVSWWMSQWSPGIILILDTSFNEIILIVAIICLQSSNLLV